MTISITTYNGNVFSFGGDNTLDIEHQCLFVFKIITFNKETNTINQRNVF